MTVNEAKIKIEEEINKVPALFEGINVKVLCDVQNTTNDTEDGEETIFLFGAVSLFTDTLAEDDTLIIPLEAEFDASGNVDEASLAERIDSFKERILTVKEKLAGAENIDTEIIALSREIDEKLEAEFKARIDRLNQSTRNNLLIAGVAAALLLVFAAICVLVGKIF